jgi:hypothetical protein
MLVLESSRFTFRQAVSVTTVISHPATLNVQETDFPIQVTAPPISWTSTQFNHGTPGHIMLHHRNKT